MNKKLTAVIVLIIVATGSGLAYLLLQDKPAGNSVTSPRLEEQTKPAPLPTAQPTEAAGMYKEYSEDTFAATSGTKILFFHAAWCPQCRQLEADIKNNAVPAGVTIFKVDYDSHQKLRQKYGVTLQTTLVKVDDNGNEIKKFVAYDDPTLEAVVRNLL